MKRSQAWSLVLALNVFTACKAKVIEDKADEASAPAQASTKDPAKESTTESDDAVLDRPKARPSLELYPPVFSVDANALPDPGQPFYFGFAADAPQAYQTVFVYTVSAYPDFNYGASPRPEFLDQLAFDKFMNDWVKQFQARLDYVKTLNDLIAEFAWSVDPQFIDDKAEPIPESLLGDLPDYVKINQRTLARRFTFKAPGQTVIKGNAGFESLVVPFDIKAYSQAQVDIGKTRSASPTDSCASCHGPLVDTKIAFLKHSSDYLAFYTDAQLIDIIVNSKYPDGSLLNDGSHLHAMATPEEENGVIAWLRNMPPFFDKLQVPFSLE